MTHFRKPDAVVFDLDGTLLETHTIIPRSLVEYGEIHGVDLSKTAWLGRSLAQVAQDIRERLDFIVSEDDLRAYMQPRQVELMAQAAADGTACPPGLSGFIGDLFLHHVPFGVATLSPRKRAMALLDAAGLSATFPEESLVCYEDARELKPAPDAFLQAAERLGVTDPSGVVGIGDSPEDMEAVRAAKMWAVGRVHGRNDDHVLAGAGAHLLVADYQNLTVERLGRLVETGE